MKWQHGTYKEQWLVADDGEILERVFNSGINNEYIVSSTRKAYNTEAAAKAAAERHANTSSFAIGEKQ